MKNRKIVGSLIGSWFPQGLRQRLKKRAAKLKKHPKWPEYAGFSGFYGFSIWVCGFGAARGRFHFAPFLLFHFAPNSSWTPTPSNSRIFTIEGAPVSVWAVRRDFDPPWGPPGTALGNPQTLVGVLLIVIVFVKKVIIIEKVSLIEVILQVIVFIEVILVEKVIIFLRTDQVRELGGKTGRKFPGCIRPRSRLPCWKS